MAARKMSRRRTVLVQAVARTEARDSMAIVPVESLERRLLMTAVSWNAGTVGSWNNAANWTPAQVPGVNDDVTINSGTVAVDASDSAGTLTAAGAANINITGSLTLSGNSTVAAALAVNGGFSVTAGTTTLSGATTVGYGSTLSASGAGTSLVASGVHTIDGVFLYTSSGATMSLPNVTTFSYSVQNVGQVRWQSSDSGSEIVLSNLQTINSITQNYFYVLAQPGGEISLPSLSTITSNYFMGMSASGSGAVLNLPNLTSYNTNFSGYLNATGGGHVIDPLITALQGVNVTITDAGSQMNTSQLSNFSYGTLTIDQPENFNNVTDIDGAALYVNNGDTLSLPGITSFSYSAYNVGQQHWQTGGAGSEIVLPNLQTISAITANYLYIFAEAGGEISLPALTSITSNYFIGLAASGTGAVLNMPSLTSYNPDFSGYLNATGGGDVIDPKLTAILGVSLTISDPGSQMDTSQLTNVSYGAINVDQAVNFQNVTTIDGTALYANNGATLSLPGVKSFVYSAYNVNQQHWQTNGTGSEILLGNLQTISSITANYFYISAQAGGEVSLPALTSITSNYYIGLSASGTGAVLNMPSLTSYNPNFAGFLNATGGGDVIDPLLTVMQGVSLTIADAGSHMNTSQLTNFSYGSISVDQPSNFNAVTDFDGTSLYANNGATLSLPGVTGFAYSAYNVGQQHWQTNGDGSEIVLANLQTITAITANYLYIFAQTSGEISLPALTTITSNYYIGVSASGPDAILNMPDLSSFNPNNSGYMTANSGGELVAGNSLTVTSGAVSFDSTSELITQNLTLINGASLYGSGIFTGAVNNSGTVGVNGGSLSLTGGGSGTGGVFITNGTNTLEFDGGTFTFDSASTISGAGPVVFNSGVVNLAGSYAVSGSTIVSGGIANLTGNVAITGPLIVSSGTLNVLANGVTVSALQFTGGTIAGSNSLEVTGAFNWSGGTLAETTTTADTAIVFAGSGMDVISGGTMNNPQGVNETFPAGGTLFLINAGDFVNTGSFANNGTIAINPLSVCTVTGTYTQHSTATLSIQIAGAPGTGDYGMLHSAGQATFGGTFAVSLANNFTVNPGNYTQLYSTYILATYPSYQAAFLAYNLPSTAATVYSPVLNGQNISFRIQGVPVVSATATNAAYNGQAFSNSSVTPKTTALGGAVTLTDGTYSYSYYTAAMTPLSSAPTAAGSYYVVVTWSGDANFASAGSIPVAFSITKPSANLTVAGHNAAYSGNADPATYTLTGVAGGSSPTGTVTLTYYVGSTVSGSGSGTAPITGGTYTVVASYGGDANYGAVTSSPSTFVISQAVPTLIVNGHNVAFNGTADPATYALTGVNGGATPTGNVVLTYYIGTTVSGSGSTTTPVTGGTYTVVASYAGDINYSAATSSAATFTITPVLPTLTVAGHNVVYTGNGDTATYTLTGVSGGPAPTGNVTLTYYVGTTTTGPGSVNTPVTGGTYTVVASYGGDSNYMSQSSAPATFTISQATPTLTVSGNNVTYTGVSDPASYVLTGVTGGAAPSGAVALTYYVGATTGGTGSTIAPITGGTYTVVASYAGDSNYAAYSTAGSTFVILPATPTLTVLGHNVTYTGIADSATFTLTGLGGSALAPTGGVTLTYYVGATVSGTGTSTAPTAGGIYTAVASYAGDANYKAVTGGPSTFTVSQATPTLTVMGNTETYTGNADPANYSLTGVGAGVAPTGPVTLTYYVGTAASGTGSTTPPVTPGTYTVVANYGGDANYIAVQSSPNTFYIYSSTATPLVLNGPAFYLKLDSNGRQLDVWNNSTGTGATLEAPALTSISQISVTNSAGSNSLVVDFSNGDPLTMGGLLFTGGGTFNPLSIIGTTGNDTLAFDSNTITLTAGFGSASITYASASQISFNGTTGTDTVVQNAQPGGGAGFNYLYTTSADNLTINQGTFTLPASTGGISTDTLGAVSIGSAGRLSLPAPTGQANRVVLVVSSLAFAGSSNAWQGRLDLQSNDLIIRNGNLSLISNQLRSGFATGNGTWNGTGIGSSAAVNDYTLLTALGAIQPVSAGTFDGQAISVNDVVIKYTYYGDATLDGKVDGSDYSRIDSGYLTHASGWNNGDFNYDGVINGSDYTLIDNAFNRQSAGLAAQVIPASKASRPVRAAQPTMVLAPSQTWGIAGSSGSSSSVASTIFSDESDADPKKAHRGGGQKPLA